MKQIQDAYIVAAKRTPVAKKGGAFRHVRPDDMLAHALRGVVDAVPEFDLNDIGDVVVGCAMPEAEQGMNVARIGLLLGDTSSLATAKEHWLYAADWQGLRRYVEDCLVVQDWFELFVAQNLVLDGLVYPLFYKTLVEDELSLRGGTAVAMLTQFMTEWYAETAKWVDAQIKTACAESPDNAALVRGWVSAWQARALEAVMPLAQRALGERAGAAVDDLATQFAARVAKCGVPA